MPYRVVMELIPKPDDTPDWIWNETNLGVITSTGGKAWTAKLNTNDSVWEYTSWGDANSKMLELDNADSTNRRYKIIEV